MVSPRDPTGTGLSWLQIGGLVVAVVAVGFGAGWLFGEAAPRRAASSLLGDVVEQETFAGDERVPADTDVAAPTSGNHVGSPRCGVRAEPVSADVQLASLAVGGVVVQYRPEDVSQEQLRRLRGIARAHPQVVLVGPNPGLDSAVVATAWLHRLELAGVDRDLLGKFVTAYRGSGPRPERGCGGGAG